MRTKFIGCLCQKKLLISVGQVGFIILDKIHLIAGEPGQTVKGIPRSRDDDIIGIRNGLIAIFKAAPEAGQVECSISLRFRRGLVRIIQVGDLISSLGQAGSYSQDRC